MCQQLGRRGIAVGWACLVFAMGVLAYPWPAALADDRPLPGCSLDLGQAAPGDFSQFKGKVLYIDFWASWCGPCQLSFPFMGTLQKDYGSRGLQVVAMNMDEKPADAAAFIAKHPVAFPVAHGPNGPCAQSLGVANMPTSFLVDRTGRIRVTHAGFRPDDAPALRSAIEGLLAEKAGQ